MLDSAKAMVVVWKGSGMLKRTVFACAFTAFLFTQVSPAQDTRKPKIPDGEAHFTPEQLQQYYRVYENADVKYLRTIFDAYLNKSGGTKEELEVLNKWDQGYFRSKFFVLSRDQNTFGGTLITILFKEKPDKVFVTWVYPQGDKREPRLRTMNLADFSDEDIKRIPVRYKQLMEDKAHAM